MKEHNSNKKERIQKKRKEEAEEKRKEAGVRNCLNCSEDISHTPHFRKYCNSVCRNLATRVLQNVARNQKRKNEVRERLGELNCRICKIDISHKHALKKICDSKDCANEFEQLQYRKNNPDRMKRDAWETKNAISRMLRPLPSERLCKICNCDIFYLLKSGRRRLVCEKEECKTGYERILSIKRNLSSRIFAIKNPEKIALYRKMYRKTLNGILAKKAYRKNLRHKVRVTINAMKETGLLEGISRSGYKERMKIFKAAKELKIQT